jgi:hypothetical protein
MFGLRAERVELVAAGDLGGGSQTEGLIRVEPSG